MRRSRRSSKQSTNQSSTQSSNGFFPCTIDELKQKLKETFNESPDLSFQTYTVEQKQIVVFYLQYQINKAQLDKSILGTLLSANHQWDAQSILNKVPLGTGSKKDQIDPIAKALIQGSIGVYVEQDSSVVTYIAPELEKRAITTAENESLVFGPKIAFTESLISNLNILRWRLDTTDFKTEKMIVGEDIPTEVRIVYLKDIANEENVNTIRQRIEELKVNSIADSNVLAQMIEDKSSSVFPQMITTELPDRLCNSLAKGKIGILVDKSPNAIVAPASIFSFFESTEDLYMRWNMGTFIRVLRMLAMFISISLTPAYVAALTYHVEIIPSSLLVSLGKSRSNVPFPPVLEALLLELLIELLREAGARLPTKVGQTMGIVGGIVLGQAAVKAGFTSNILIIIIALSALASFTAPSYMMGTAVRIVRFPMIILSGLYGLVGIFFGLSFLLIHLLKVTSIGRPYLIPIYPFTPKDFDNSIFRLPWSRSTHRPIANQPKDIQKYPEKRARKKKDHDDK
ncbi:spore germination protein [Pontibacillus marinus]|uniref:Spore germination protein n=1 Tax=Pontibacillus marinus BH030004 = DSM 16465 TaxID=1385511 RepID=A0A0A5FR60_9BACI|nr:spore germination protein [Pontibacillus marinus]KGX83281.1 spore germination protein [Pontibacillus marinus BH030004 = DSM 16465]